MRILLCDHTAVPTRLRDILTSGSRLRYAAWRLAKGTSPLAVTLQSGPQLMLRPPPARDLTTAHDIFVSGIYDAAAASSGDLIVDVGGNVGFSSVYFAARFPDSRILAFEPHPLFADLFEHHMAINGFAPRVTLVRAAAHTAAGHARLTDAEDSSALADRGTLPIETADLFAALGTTPVAVLKMDIEGGEMPLLADSRFDALQLRMLLLEWHDPSESGRAKAWCTERLEALGYDVQPGRQDGPVTGLITATRPFRSG